MPRRMPVFPTNGQLIAEGPIGEPSKVFLQEELLAG